MPYDDVQKFSEAAVNKAKLLKEHPGKYFLRAVMAGFFIVVAMIFSNVVGNTFQSTDPAWGKGWKSMAGKLHRKLCRMPDSLRNFRTGRCFRYCRLLRRIYWK